MENQFIFNTVSTLNLYGGWLLMLFGFFSGALIGLFFHREDFWGGYGSFRRRIVRLGHIACVALGMINILFSLVPTPVHVSSFDSYIPVLLIIGGVAMPTICFLTGWKQMFRQLFFIPVLSLSSAVVIILLRAVP